MAARRRITLVDTTELSPSVRGLAFEVEGGTFAYEPGQSIDLFVPVPLGIPAKRAYSIASAPMATRPGYIELAVTRVPDGVASARLHELPTGAGLDAYGPRGGFVRHEFEQSLPALFVAAGSGLAPLRAMLQAELSRSDGPRIGLLFGCRTTQDILWHRELDLWAGEHARFSYWVTLSRPQLGWTGQTGYVQDHVVEIVELLAPRLVYVCGLSRMTIEVEHALERAGLGRGQFRSEQYDR